MEKLKHRIDRAIDSEHMFGMKVSAYREAARCPPDVNQDDWDEFVGDNPVFEYAGHWSTLRNGERLFTEADVLDLLRRIGALEE